MSTATLSAGNTILKIPDPGYFPIFYVVLSWFLADGKRLIARNQEYNLGCHERNTKVTGLLKRFNGVATHNMTCMWSKGKEEKKQHYSNRMFKSWFYNLQVCVYSLMRKIIKQNNPLIHQCGSWVSCLPSWWTQLNASFWARASCLWMWKFKPQCYKLPPSIVMN